MSLYSRIKDNFPALGRFTEVPAGIIDRAYLNEPEGFFTKSWTFLKVRAVFIFMFLPLALVDLAVSGILGVRYAVGAFLLSDAQQDSRLASMKQYATIFSKNLYAILGSVFGLVSPKLVAFYFTPEKSNQQGVSAGGNYHHAKDATRVQPETIEELQKIITEAKSAGRKVMPIGAGLSQGKQFLPEGSENGQEAIVVDLSKLNKVRIRTDSKTAIVGAGAKWSDIQSKADELELALKVMQASNVFSVGGSIGTNIHGWDHQSGVLSNVIESVDIINAQGELENLTPDHPLFNHVMGGFGLCGIVVSATIKLTDNEKLKEVGTLVETKDYAEYFKTTVLPNTKAKMHLYRLSLDPDNLLGEGVAVSYVSQDDEVHPVKTANLSMEAAQGTRFDRVMINIARRLDWVRRIYWQGERKRMLANDDHPLMTTNEIMQPPINAMFNSSVSEAEWLQEYYLPAEELDAFLKELGTLLMANHVPLLNASVRFVKQHEGPLSYSDGGDRFAVVLCFNQSLRPEQIIAAKKWLRQAQHMAVQHKGTYYLPYQHVSSPEDFAKAYPRAHEFQAMKEQVDPTHVFSSEFYHTYLAPKQTAVNHFKVIMEDESKKEHFKGFLENVLQRVDSDKFYALLEDVMKYNDSHEDIYKELTRRLPEVMPSAIGGLKRILNSLSAIKADLGAQARALLPSDWNRIDGLVEIGYPGRFMGEFKKHYEVTGTTAAVYEAQSVSDYVQTSFPRPYNQFVKLDYNVPRLTGLSDDSADVITCYVGLHHFPVNPIDELDLFLKEIRRVLRPGGRFLLVDHDINSDETMTMAHMAHMIFNAVSGTSVEEEMAETRNFQPMEYWIARLAANDLTISEGSQLDAKIRVNDPSRNRMICVENQKLEKMFSLKQQDPAKIEAVDLSVRTSRSGSRSPTFFITKGEVQQKGEKPVLSPNNTSKPTR